MATTFDPKFATGSAPEPLSSRLLVRCYRHYDDAKHAHEQLRVVAGIPDKRMALVACGLEWREDLPTETLYKVACTLAGAVGAGTGVVFWWLGLTSAGTDWLTAALVAALAGVAFGFVVATTVARLREWRGSDVQTGHVEPRQYDIFVAEEFAPVAREVLGGD